MARTPNLGLLGNLLKGGLAKKTQIAKGLPKRVAGRKVDQKILKGLDKIKNIDRSTARTMAKAPGLGKLFETTKDVATGPDTYKRIKDFSNYAPVSKAKDIAIPMLAASGLGHTLNKARKKEKEKALREFQQKGGKNKVAEISQLLEKSAADLEKSASVIKKLKNDKEETMEKVASLESKMSRREEAFKELIKMAKMDQISIEDLPEELEKLASMEEEDFKVEMRALEKVASNSLLNPGNVSEKSTGSDNPIIEFVMSNS